MVLTIVILVLLACVITFFTERKTYAKRKAEYEKLIANKTEFEKRSIALGDLLVMIGIGGLAISSIQARVGGMSSGYIMLGSIFSLIGGGFLRKRMKDMLTKHENSIDSTSQNSLKE